MLKKWLTEAKEDGGLAHLAGKTKDGIVALTKTVFEQALLQKVISEVPTHEMEVPEYDQEPPDPFDMDEVNRILESRTPDREQELNIFGFMCFTGLAVSEASGLAYEDIDFLKWTAEIKVIRNDKEEWRVPKVKKRQRVIQIPTLARKFILEQMNHTFDDVPETCVVKQRLATDKPKVMKRVLVFRNFRTNKPCFEGNLRNWWGRFLKRIGVRHRGFNNGRHTFASQAITHGLPTNWIINQLGHSSERMLRKHYGKIINKDMPRFDNVFSEALEEKVICKGDTLTNGVTAPNMPLGKSLAQENSAKSTC
ncbi:tyrosine-type recombinase/integrase [Pleionea sp. CnH1-48]|uniref:tyrosine-type recombinase/integrase n=1 Tax=Pleionea sp. CnH1-48 TaxID=2954494 RepID=UPI002096C7B2|nr:tyrosine-type recombinase/integrase [Pleionea sp. CnH1-48]MCO7225897.1 tyrosine-type recombinase/integrase [Pleionea sp. CnH1-48]